jgi:hypothetical protein
VADEQQSRDQKQARRQVHQQVLDFEGNPN